LDLDQGLLSWASTANINDNNSQIDNTMYLKNISDANETNKTFLMLDLI